MTSEPTVFVVDDDKAVRESLCWLIESVGLSVEAYGSAQAFLEAYDPDRPGCLVADVRLPGMSGLELQAKLAEQSGSLPVIIITGHADVPSAVRAMKIGAVDFIEKPFSDQMLLERIRHAVEMDAGSRRTRHERLDLVERLQRLTPREKQVMDLVVAGKANKQIAQDLGLSPKTVEVHRANVMLKMRAKNVAHLVRLVMSHQPS
jgi:FixJ family two-component response regulator